MSVITVTEAQKCLPELVDRVQAGEEVTLTRDGQPVAHMVRPDHHDRRQTSHDEVRRSKWAKQESRTQLIDPELSVEREEDLERAIRTDLDKR